MNCVVNLGFILCLQLQTKYSIALTPNLCGILVYKLHTSRVSKTVPPVTFCLHVFNNSMLPLMLLLTCLVKGLKIRSKKLLNLQVGHFGHPNIGLSFKSFGSEIVISFLFVLRLLYVKFQIYVFLGSHKSYLFQYNYDLSTFILNL